MSSHSSVKRRLFWGTLIIVIGLLFLFHNLDLFDFGDFIATFWPLILVIIGIKMIVTSRRTKQKNDKPSEAKIQGATFSSDVISESRILGDIQMKIEHENFRGGSTSNIIGNTTLDLSQIGLAEGKHDLTISGFVGDVVLSPPQNVPYAINISITIGDLVMFGQKDNGFGINKAYKSEAYDAANTKLDIHISYFIGDAKIL